MQVDRASASFAGFRLDHLSLYGFEGFELRFWGFTWDVAGGALLGTMTVDGCLQVSDSRRSSAHSATSDQGIP